MKQNIFEFDPVIYPYKLWIVIDKTPNIIVDKFNDYKGDIIEGLELDTKNMDAFAMQVSRKDDKMLGATIYFRSKKSMSYDLVAHESSHAAKYLFEHIGADIKEHEPFEYVIGWIASCCEKVKNNEHELSETIQFKK